VAISADGQRIAAFSVPGREFPSSPTMMIVKVWDTASGAERFTRQLGTSIRAFGTKYLLALSRDGRRIAAASYSLEDYHGLRVWNVNSGEAELTLPAMKISAVAFSPDGKRLVTGSGDGLVRIWDLAASPEKRTTMPYLDDIRGMQRLVAVSADGQRFATAGDS
jgi:WD40 repeat protein